MFTVETRTNGVWYSTKAMKDKTESVQRTEQKTEEKIPHTGDTNRAA